MSFTYSDNIIMPGQGVNDQYNELEIPIFLFDGMENRIDDQIDNLWDRSEDAYDEALSAIRDLSNENFYISPGYVDLIDFSWFNEPDFIKPTAPDISTAEFEIDTSGQPEYTQVEVTYNDYGEPDELTDVAPAISLPDVPAPLAATIPEEPADATVDLPTAPDLSIPAVPTLDQINLPAEPDIDFDALQADIDALYDDRPTITQDEMNSYLEPITNAADDFRPNALAHAAAVTDQWQSETQAIKFYSREDEVLDVFEAIINGTRETGLPAAVENQLYDRGRAREDREAFRAEQEVLVEWASRGFTLPQGIINARLDTIRQESLLRKNELNREIIINQHQAKIEEFWKTTENTLNFANQRFNLYFQMLELGVEMQKNVVNSLVEAVRARADFLQANATIYNAVIALFEARIRAQLAELDEYKALLDARKIRTEINAQEVQIYTERLRAVQIKADLFRTEMDAARLELEVQAQKIENYRSKVEAYKALVDAKTSEFDGFKAQVDAEVSKVSIFEAQVNAYAEKIRAYAAKTDALTKQDDLKIKLEQARIDAFDASVRAWQAKLSSEETRIGAVRDRIASQISKFQAEIDNERADKNIDLDAINARIRLEEINGTLGRANAEILNENRRFVKELEVRVMEAIGDISSRVTAGAMAAMDLSLQAQLSQSQSSSFGGRHDFDETVSA